MAGARTGSAVREAKCQVLSNCGGAAVRMPRLTSAGRSVAARGGTGAKESGSRSGVGMVRRRYSARYCDFSTVQQLLQSLAGWCVSAVSTEQRRNSKPGTDSSWQCAEMGSQIKAARANTMFLNRRTRNIDTQSATSVQLNLMSGAFVSRLRVKLVCLCRKPGGLLFHPIFNTSS